MKNLRIQNIKGTISRNKYIAFLVLLFILTCITRHFLKDHILRNFFVLLIQIALLILITIKIARKFGYIWLYVIIAVIVCEVYSRFIPDQSIYSSDQLKVMQAAHFKVPPDAASKSAGTGLKYYDYYSYGLYPGKEGMMTITGYYSSRKVPASAPPENADFIVWLFGGSTMLNIETNDSLSIANQVAYTMRAHGLNASVVNFGMWGFQSSLEYIKFCELLKQVPVSERPDVVAFYDGYNDAGFTVWFGAGKINENSSRKLKAVIEGSYPALAIFYFSKLMSSVSAFWSKFIEPSVNPDRELFGGWDQSKFVAGSKNLSRGVDIFEANTRMAISVCNIYGIQPFFFLQPMMFTKKNHTDLESSIIEKSLNKRSMNMMDRFYEIARLRMKKYPDFFDLSELLNDSKESDFFDLGHTGPFTGIAIGKALADTILLNMRQRHLNENDIIYD